ncbi:MAG: methyl-accepting chemotaxis protein [Candidatus Competibacteraceae bacterium]|jgi:twitching motility protein PilJ|nr:methyl-accepting chemotaxis protein [Candidatus Competibacteraceae bacterium]
MHESPSESSTQGGSLKYIILIACLVMSIIVMGLFSFWIGQYDVDYQVHGQLISEQGLLSRELVLQAREAANGNESAFASLERARSRFDDILLTQKEGDADTGLSALPTALSPEFEEVDRQWQPVQAGLNTVLESRDAVLSIRNFVPLLEGVMPQLENTSDEIAKILAESGASVGQVYRVTRQPWLAQRINSYFNTLLEGGANTAAALDNFDRDIKLFDRVLQGMSAGDSRLGIQRITGGPAVAKVAELSDDFQSVKVAADQILAEAPELFQAQSAAQAIADQGGALLGAIGTLQEQYGTMSGGPSIMGLPVNSRLVLGIGVLALILLALSVLQTNRDTRLRLWESELRKRDTEEQNRRNQEAILRLLDELGDLAEGDLTVQATVTEDITGAIADSVNYAIEALRDLVSTINYTSELMASAAQETRSVADRLARASEVQARQIESASSTMTQMAHSMNEVSGKTAASADEADKSVAIAHEGGERVRRTIQGMDVIREHIQETSKRIKRLGESSQEIGDIVALINDISDQTNILALNAAIQASSAGEAGRGFGVVADEVQRLAERSGNATKRIETLVKTIQADTNEAIISMEKSTTEVVNGADLAEKAGEALEEIETVSAKLAALINDVSKAAGQVTEMTSRVSTAMTSINEITAQTSESSVATASSIGKLNQLAQELQQSVAGFRLPEQVMATNE